ncbi:hypothetical protein Leryth_017082 [Lithospermum erythrorhizon]|nr:hypothetical protein Leryth_017082 [Lithospermum erythrorhizon]
MIFTRDGNDLLMNYKVTLSEAIGGKTVVEITTLDGRDLSIPVSDIISPSYELVVKKEGMPIAKGPSKRGDFKTLKSQLPPTLSLQQRTDSSEFLVVDSGCIGLYL